MYALYKVKLHYIIRGLSVWVVMEIVLKITHR